ncbi:unnamed protein product, partial [Pylaiella littoralis]
RRWSCSRLSWWRFPSPLFSSCTISYSQVSQYVGAFNCCTLDRSPLGSGSGRYYSVVGVRGALIRLHGELFQVLRSREERLKSNMRDLGTGDRSTKSALYSPSSEAKQLRVSWGWSFSATKCIPGTHIYRVFERLNRAKKVVLRSIGLTWTSTGHASSVTFTRNSHSLLLFYAIRYLPRSSLS